MKCAALACSLSLVSTVALASPSYPILSKTYSGGLQPPPLAESASCEIQREDVVITHIIGTRKTVEHRKPIGLTDDLLATVQEASKGTLQEEPAPTDGPTTEWQATYTDDEGRRHQLPLKATGSMRLLNPTSAAAALVALIDRNCG